MAVMRARRGFTLIELMIYVGLASVALLVVTSLFVISQRTQRQTASSYLVGGRFASAVETIRRDLQATSLVSVQAYPNSGHRDEPPGMAFASAYAVDGPNQDSLVVNRYGAPDWVTHVYYSVVPHTRVTGQLVRWRQAMSSPDFIPTLPTQLPSAVASDDRHVLIENVLLPGASVEGVGTGGRMVMDQHGGFEVTFVRRRGGPDGEEYFSTESPRAGPPADNTRLVRVVLRTLQNERSSTPNFCEFEILAHPRH